MYKHLIATTQIKEHSYVYHYASKEANKVLYQRDALAQTLPEHSLNVLYGVHVWVSNEKSLKSVQAHNKQLKTMREVKNAEEFTKLVFDRKLLRLADKLQYREMNNLDQLIEWFNEN